MTGEHGHLLVGAQGPALMGLSFVVAVFSSHAALDLGARLRAAQPRARAVWLPAAAIAVPVRTTKMPA